MLALKVYKYECDILVKLCNKCHVIKPTSKFYKQKMYCKSSEEYRYYPINMCKKCKSEVYKMKTKKVKEK